MLTTDIERKENTTIVRCVGRVVVGDELSKLRDAVLCQLDKQAILLDLSGGNRCRGLGIARVSPYVRPRTWD
jgi:hypothetical protein